MNNLVERARDARDLAIAKFLREDFEGVDFEESLNDIDWVAVRGLCDAETVPREKRIAIGIDSLDGVAIVVAVVG